MDDRVTPDVMKDIFYRNEGTLKFCVDISITIVSGRGGQEGWYLEDIEGS